MKQMPIISKRNWNPCLNKKTARNKIFLLKKFVNMKLKEETLMIDHLNDFQSIVNQLAAMKIVMHDEMQAYLLLCSLPDS